MQVADLITAADAAKRLGISHAQVTRLCLNGTLDYLRIGSRYAIDRQSLARARKRAKPGRPRKVLYAGPSLDKLVRVSLRERVLAALKEERG